MSQNPQIYRTKYVLHFWRCYTEHRSRKTFWQTLSNFDGHSVKS